MVTFCLVADDIMDRSETRRGKPCWYRVEDIGVLAVNDAFLIEHTLYRILSKYFGTHPRYTDFLDIFLEVSYKTVLGQCLDTEAERIGLNRELMDRYKKIAHYKTSFYTIYLPMALATTLLGINGKDGFLKKVEDVAKDIGFLFQIQDDYLDCYGNETVTGKIGTDIQNGKCTWLYVNAIELASPNQLSILENNYGHEESSCVAEIKAIYDELCLQIVYNHTVAALRIEIGEKLEAMGCETIEKAVFCMLEIFHNRNK
ncbi:Farnesyl pyrophosphate synthase [Orchesella cincta]|uniref:Farnesyl pyrophosphate synthase n=1 Tax=Orchesella cincta TaxID=48709 RepID=A0A1D2MBR0_ORCCI|nr:Farnesyl pyrophosphate synthase [Orchesella cincta]